MEDKLKPCPFCGGEAELLNNGSDYFWVICLNRECGCEMSGMDSLKEAYKQWNTRKPMDRIVEELESQCSKTVSMGRMNGKTLTAGFNLGILKAIEIVKNGGKNE